MFKKVSMALGLVCFAGLASAAQAFAAPPRPSVAAATSVTVKIPQRDAGYAGVTTIGDPSFPGVSGDSQPYHLKGSVVYEPRGNSLAFKEIHISGWSDSPEGRPEGACGHFGVNAKHLTINGHDFSGRLVVEAAISPRGWVISNWVLRFLGPIYPSFPRGTTVAIRADAAYSGACIPVGNHSLATSVAVR